MKYISNPGLYRELATPVETKEEADKRMTAFFDELRELREKHKIPDVVVAASIYVEDGIHPEGAILSQASNMGNFYLAAPLFALGVEQYLAMANEPVEMVSEGEVKKRKEHLGCCPSCGSGDMQWCNISVRPYCNDCKWWLPSHHNDEAWALKELKKKQEEAEVDPTNKT